MKKLLVALLLIVSSVLSFGAEKVSYEKIIIFKWIYIL